VGGRSDQRRPQSFVTGWPLWRGRPLLGQIDMSMLNERWVGCSGRTTLFNGEEVRSSGCTRLQDARLYTISPDGFSAEEWRMFEAVGGRVRTHDLWAYFDAFVTHGASRCSIPK